MKNNPLSLINEFLRPVSFEILMINIKANITFTYGNKLARLNKKVRLCEKSR